MIPWRTLLVLVAIVFFILAAIPVPSRVQLGWVGMCFFAASTIAP